MARSIEQLAAWAKLHRFCLDGRAAIQLTDDMRGAVIETENKLQYLCKVEAATIRLLRILIRMDAFRDPLERAALAGIMLLVTKVDRGESVDI